MKHGYTKRGAYPREYKAWVDVKQRCYNPKATRYEDWGGRGITVCDRWKDNFIAFLEDMGTCPPNMSLDRYPNQNGNYEPGNCRWATTQEQARNKRNNHLLTYKGETKTMSEWAEVLNIKYPALSQRVNRLKWPVEKALDKQKPQLTHKGETKTLAEWAKALNIKYATLYKRLTISGWTVEEALGE